MGSLDSVRVSPVTTVGRVPKGTAFGITLPIVGHVTRLPDSAGKILIIDSVSPEPVAPMEGTLGIVAANRSAAALRPYGVPLVADVPGLASLAEGDIAAIHPNGAVETLFRVASCDNALFVTGRCNSRCLMCSQPPSGVDDSDYRLVVNLKAASLIPRSTATLGITGGEPTLLGDRLRLLLEALNTTLPDTTIHVLSNGRAFCRPQYAEDIASAASTNVIFGIPLYSDHASAHDAVVRAEHAFSQTVLGLHALARSGVRVEIRTVLQRPTCARLLQLAQFIHRYLPFAEHVSFMGLEHVGLAVRNTEELWIEPREFSANLLAAVEYLVDFQYNVSIYNLQLCLLPPSLWPYCRQSISDWKRRYLAVCDRCTVRANCGGVFATSTKLAAGIGAL